MSADAVLTEAPRKAVSAAKEPSDLDGFFIVGAPRCGTTSLSRWLANHPDICFAKPKETHFFVSVDAEGDLSRIRRRYLKRYFPRFSEDRQIFGEGSVTNLYSPEALARILESFPRAKFIVMLRNPLDMAYSFHGKMVVFHQESEKDFEAAWRLQERRSRGEKIPAKCMDPRMLRYGDIACLGSHIETLLETVGKERCHIVVLEDMERRPRDVYLGVLKFLGLKNDGPRRLGRYNRHRVLRGRPFLESVLGLLFIPLSPLLLGARMRVSPIRNFAKRCRRRLTRLLTATEPRTDLDPAFRRELVAFFEPEIQKIESLLNRDFKHWRESDED